MKLDINSNGDAIIIPETQMESYALKKWYADFSQHCKVDGEAKTTLSILSYGQGQDILNPVKPTIPPDEKI